MSEYVRQRGQRDPNYQRHPGSLWIDEKRSELIVQYPEEWIAADGFGILLHSRTHEDLIEQIKASGIAQEKFAMAFIEIGIL
ncbi:MAG: hypothetical protein AAB539_01115 [Patescibacteria group bacterium]